MTLEEMLAREAIRDVMARYTMAGDRLKRDDFLAVFTQDAVLESEFVPEADAFRYDGRAAIGDWLARFLPTPGETPRPSAATFIRHHLTTSQIELIQPTVARARTYWTAWTDIGPDHAGYYLDSLRKEGEHWLIAHRKVRMDWRAPNSLFTAAVENTREV